METYCDFCIAQGKKKVEAVYDGKTIYGSWAFMCEYHFKICGIGLGVGKGQLLKEINDNDE